MSAPIIMNGTNTQQIGLSNLLPQDSSRQAMSIVDQSEMSNHTTCEVIRNVTGSLALVDGPTLFDLLDGPQIAPVGPPVCPANHSRSRQSTRKLPPKVRPTIATYCPFLSRSLRSASLQSSLESKCETQLSGVGSMKHSGRWKTLVTPAGRSLRQLSLRARDMSESGFPGWPTPAARDGRDISRSIAFLSQRKRHSPSMATRLLEQGAPWTVSTAVYCIAMGYPSSWNDTRLKATAPPSPRKKLSETPNDPRR